MVDVDDHEPSKTAQFLFLKLFSMVVLSPPSSGGGGVGRYLMKKIMDVYFLRSETVSTDCKETRLKHNTETLQSA